MVKLDLTTLVKLKEELLKSVKRPIIDKIRDDKEEITDPNGDSIRFKLVKDISEESVEKTLGDNFTNFDFRFEETKEGKYLVFGKKGKLEEEFEVKFGAEEKIDIEKPPAFGEPEQKEEKGSELPPEVDIPSDLTSEIEALKEEHGEPEPEENIEEGQEALKWDKASEDIIKQICKKNLAFYGSTSAWTDPVLDNRFSLYDLIAELDPIYKQRLEANIEEQNLAPDELERRKRVKLTPERIFKGITFLEGKGILTKVQEKYFEGREFKNVRKMIALKKPGFNDKDKFIDKGYGVEEFPRNTLYLSRIFGGIVKSEEDAYIQFKNYRDAVAKSKGNKDYVVLEGVQQQLEKEEEEEAQMENKPPENFDQRILDLETFDHQDLFPVDDSPSILDMVPDLIRYYEGNYTLICDNGHRLPNETEFYDLLSYIYGHINELKDYILYSDASVQQVKDLLNKNETLEAKYKILLESVNSDLNSKGEIDNKQYKGYELFVKSQKKWRSLFKCPVKGCNKSIFRGGLYYVSEAIWEICDALSVNRQTILVGNPGDGKSQIGIEFLNWTEWKYHVPYGKLAVSSATMDYTIRGGLDPTSFSGKKAIKYGVLSRALLKKGFVPFGTARNMFFDEINRTDFRELSFLMSFFESPHTFTIEDDEARPFINPNQRKGRACWIFMATMNVADQGNEAMSSAFESRFSMIEAKYTKEMVILILHRVFSGLSPGEEQIAILLVESTRSWAVDNHVLFPAGIRHLISFFKRLRMDLKQIINPNKYLRSVMYRPSGGYQEFIELKNDDGDVVLAQQDGYVLSEIVQKIMVSTILMPITDKSAKENLESIKATAFERLPSILKYIRDDLQKGTFNFYA
jgi:MoxR-like ATPase